MKTLVLAIALLASFGATTAHATTEDSAGWQCARMGDRFCGGKSERIYFAGHLVLVRGYATPRHALQLYVGRNFRVGHFATHCKPVNPYVVRVDIGDTTYAVIHACRHIYHVDIS